MTGKNVSPECNKWMQMTYSLYAESTFGHLKVLGDVCACVVLTTAWDEEKGWLQDKKNLAMQVKRLLAIS